MREALRPTLITALSLLSSTALAQTWTDFQVDGETRQALVYVPEDTVDPPLLISLHGRGIGAGWNQGGMMKFEPIADREKFIVVYPEANNNLNWDLSGNYDINFILKIIDDMAEQHNVDRNRVYASGFSMGGMFSYTLACKIPETIAAIAPGNGYPLGGQSGCVTTRPVPIFHMHGTADDFVAYAGIQGFLNSKLEAYGCPMTPVTTDPYPVGSATSKSFTDFWGPCTDSNGNTSSVTLVHVTGMIHDWATAGKANTNEDPEFTGRPFDIDGSEEAWAFLKTQSLLGPDPGNGSGGSGDPGSGGGPGAGTGGTSTSTGGEGAGTDTGGMNASGGAGTMTGGAGTESGGMMGAEDASAGGSSCTVGRAPGRTSRHSSSWWLAILLGGGALLRGRLTRQE